MVRRAAPGSFAEAAAALAACAEAGTRVRPVGGGTKLSWGAPPGGVELELSTLALDAIAEHNEGDLTAVLEAGVPLARAQERFAAADQMLALDPPLGAGSAATVGGVVATGDSGPRRHRYGAPRDLVLGVTVALSDGTLARSGGKVIKNVAGYDLAKLFAGSFGALGAILQVAVRLHPRPPRSATAVGRSADPAAVAAAASALAHAPHELESLDVRHAGGEGAVLARVSGVEPGPSAREAAEELSRAGLAVEVVEDDEELWSAQREGQRSAGGTVVRVSSVQSRLGAVLREAERLAAPAVGRAALGLTWLRLEDRVPAEQVAAVSGLREALAPSPCAVLDAPEAVRAQLDPWGALDAPALMRRVRERFDPAGVLAGALR